MNTTRVSSKATRRDWLGLAVIALPCLLYSMDLTVLNLAVPHLTADLRPSAAELLWIVDIYGFVLAGSLIPMGVLGDRIGRRRLLMLGAAAFGAASIFAAFSQSTVMLITARAILGLAAATLAPSTLSLIRNMFLDPAQRTVAIGVWVASFSAGGAIGPLLGGIVLQHFWWGAVFLLNVPVMLLLLVVGPVLLPEFRDPAARRTDVASAALSLVSVLAIIYWIKHMAEDGLGWSPAVAICSGVVLGGFFLHRQRKLADPFIDLDLFRRPAFSTAVGLNILGFFTAFGTFLLIAQYLQLVMGLSPIAAGLWSAPSGAGFVAGSMLAPFFARRFKPAQVMAGGFAIAAFGFGLLTQVGAAQELAVLVTGYVILSFGLAPVFTMVTDQIIGFAPPERAGVASGVAETSAELGGALGIAVLGSIVTAIYRRTMTTSLPVDVLPSAADAARDTLGGAIAMARELPDQVSTMLTNASRTAFLDGFRTVGVICAAITVIAAITTSLALGVSANAAPIKAAAPEE
jgi:MFS transporter, DHA2 family, multidrug resistance protein